MDVYLKDEFSEWLGRQIKPDGQPYSELTIKEYIRALSKACREFKNLDIDTTDLFKIETLSEFSRIQEIIRKNEDFQSINLKYGKGSLSAGMLKYAEFLSSRKTKGITAWFVGAVLGQKDQTQRFVNEGIWENGYADKYTDLVKSINVGDRIAIKSSYVRKHNLPFDNRSNSVSVLGIKAIGVVTHNFNDGKKVSVNWELVNPIKEWYFFTSRTTIWKVEENQHWMNKNLIDFAFHGKEQFIKGFISHSYWKERYGEHESTIYEWTSFYETIAKELLKYKNNRTVLVNGIHKIFESLNMKNPLMEAKNNGIKALLNDICPFTVFGLFNKGITNKNRRMIMSELAAFLDIQEQVPNSFDGITVLNNMMAFFFGPEGNRKESDIDNLWRLFETAIILADDFTEENKNEFTEIYDKVAQQYGIQWNITFGLYWIKPWDFLPLDQNTRTTLTKKLNITIPSSSSKKTCTGEEYIELIEVMKQNFEDEEYPVHSFPELSYKSWSEEIDSIDGGDVYIENEDPPVIVYESYTRQDFLSEVFMNEDKYETVVSLLERKRNLILQGAPGVGKTFAAKRLAYSIIGKRDDTKIKMIQFHQSYSYEDFIMGYRPKDIGFELKEGPFYRFCNEASKDQSNKYFFIIDEINRGNMSKIFGELMMLIENDKRGHELTLTYSDKPFSVPKNLYIIGLMNTADRSLAIIDYALRRRFSFIEMEPAFGTEAFRKSLLSQGAKLELINKIEMKIGKLNEEILNDINLGKGFQIGHSYFSEYVDSDKWYEEVIKYEIDPLIREYWFDDEEKARNYIEELLR